MSDRAGFTDAPELNGFFAPDGRFFRYVMGGAPDDPGKDDKVDDELDDEKDPDDTEVDDSDGKKKTFTQEEVNKLIAKEVAKGSRGKVDPKELGFTSAKEMQEFLDAQKAKAEADKTEAEKKLEEAIEAAKQEAKDGILSTANERVLKAEFRIEALDAGIPKDRLEDAYVIAKLQEDWDPKISDEGEVSGLTEEFFTALKEAKPFLFAEENDEDDEDRDNGAAARGKRKKGEGRQADLAGKYPAIANLPAAAGKS